MRRGLTGALALFAALVPASLFAQASSPVSGYPITFAVDGKQYIAVATGPSGEATSTLRLTPELKPSATTQVVVFALP